VQQVFCIIGIKSILPGFKTDLLLVSLKVLTNNICDPITSKLAEKDQKKNSVLTESFFHFVKSRYSEITITQR